MISERTVFLWRIVAMAVIAVLLLILALLPLSLRAQVPAEAQRWQRELARQSRLEWGLEAPIATFGAQIEQESAWHADARSPVGARGLAQFMPSTATWLAGAYSALGPADPLNPAWALRAMARYDRILFDRVPGADRCEQMAFALSQYNGGGRFFDRARALCVGDCDARKWFGNVELVDDGRALAAWTENRRYPMQILLVREPRYVAAGFGSGMCTP